MPRLSNRKRVNRENGAQGKPDPKTLTNEQIRLILDWGYVIIPYSKSSDTNVAGWDLDKLSDQVLDQGQFVFNNAANGEPGDGSRSQLSRDWSKLPGQAARIISEMIAASFPHLAPGDAQLLHSAANGHDQRPHTDTTSGFSELKSANIAALYEHIKSERVPLSVIITFSKQSSLHVWPSSHNIIWAAKAKTKKEWSSFIQIPPFSALVFRQDLVHAGTKYKVANLRLHFYMNLIADDYKSQKDRTFYVDEKFWLISKPKRNK
jgi:hypothetical protein